MYGSGTYSKAAILAKKKRAKHLVINTSLTGLDICKIVNIAPKTLTKWNKQYGWANKRQIQVNNKLSGLSTTLSKSQLEVLEDIETYTMLNHTENYQALTTAIENFLQYKKQTATK